MANETRLTWPVRAILAGTCIRVPVASAGSQSQRALTSCHDNARHDNRTDAVLLLRICSGANRATTVVEAATDRNRLPPCDVSWPCNSGVVSVHRSSQPLRLLIRTWRSSQHRGPGRSRRTVRGRPDAVRPVCQQFVPGRFRPSRPGPCCVLAVASREGAAGSPPSESSQQMPRRGRSPTARAVWHTCCGEIRPGSMLHRRPPLSSSILMRITTCGLSYRDGNNAILDLTRRWMRGMI